MPGDALARQVDVLSRAVEIASLVQGSQSSRRNVFVLRELKESFVLGAISSALGAAAEFHRFS